MGVLPPGRRDRGQRGRHEGRHTHRVGVPQLQLGRIGDPYAYAVPNVRTEFHSSDSPLRQGSYRALASTANSFARESAMDELAHAVGMDPLAFRLKNLKERATAGRAGSRRQAVRLGQGEAGGGARLRPGVRNREGQLRRDRAPRSPSTGKGQVRVVRAMTAFECGAVLNPDHLKNQVEGCVMMGLGGALFEQIDFADGQDSESAILGLPRAAVPRYAAARNRAPRPQGPAVRRCGRDADHRHRSGNRQCDLRGNRNATPLPADGAGRLAGDGQVTRAFAIVPACGHSTRMGRPKLALPLGGSTVIERIVSTLRAGGVERVLVVVGPHVPEVARFAESAGAQVLSLKEATPDMRTTVECGLDRLEEQYRPAHRRMLVPRPGGSPGIWAGVVKELLAATTGAHSIIVPTHAGRRGHPALLRWRHASGIRADPPNEGINAYLRSHGDELFELPVADPGVLANLDTPEDYERIRADHF